jgi:peptide/nickel transport system substrate-binding protein
VTSGGAKCGSKRASSIGATDFVEQKQLCSEIQLQAFLDVPYIPLGAFYFATAYRRDLTGIMKGDIPLFTNVRRAEATAGMAMAAA